MLRTRWCAALHMRSPASEAHADGIDTIKHSPSSVSRHVATTERIELEHRRPAQASRPDQACAEHKAADGALPDAAPAGRHSSIPLIGSTALKWRRPDHQESQTLGSRDRRAGPASVGVKSNTRVDRAQRPCGGGKMIMTTERDHIARSVFCRLSNRCANA